MNENFILDGKCIDIADMTLDIKDILLSSKCKIVNINAETMLQLLKHCDMYDIYTHLDVKALSVGEETVTEKIYNIINLGKRKQHELTLYGVKFVYW